MINNEIKKEPLAAAASLWGIAFILWFVCDVNIAHSTIAQIAMVVFMVASVFFSYQKNISIKLNGVLVIYMLFILVCVCNVLSGRSINPNNSMFFIKSMIKNTFFAIAFHYYWKYVGSQKAIKTIVTSTVVASVLLVIITFVKTRSIVIRGDSGLTNANILALCAAFSTCLIVGSEERLAKNDCLKIIWLVFFCILAGTKKALFGCLIGTILIMFIKKPSKILRNILVSLIVLFAVYIAIYNIPLLYDSIGVRIDDFLYIIESGKRDNRSTSIRFELMEDCLNAYKNGHSLFWGNGVNCYYTISSRGLYSHCNYTELLFSVGIVGIITYYCMHLKILLHSIRIAIVKHNAYSAIPVALIVFILFSDIGLVSYFERISLLLIIICKEICDYGFETNSADKGTL